jgi:hypothetical protein
MAERNAGTLWQRLQLWRELRAQGIDVGWRLPTVFAYRQFLLLDGEGLGGQERASARPAEQEARAVLGEAPQQAPESAPALMAITRTSLWSGIERTQELPITPAQLAAWQGGMVIQTAMPQLTASEREFVISGMTNEEWQEMSTVEEPEEEADAAPPVTPTEALDTLRRHLERLTHPERDQSQDEGIGY